MLVNNECWKCGEVGHKGKECRIDDQGAQEQSFLAILLLHGVSLPSTLKLRQLFTSPPKFGQGGL